MEYLEKYHVPLELRGWQLHDFFLAADEVGVPYGLFVSLWDIDAVWVRLRLLNELRVTPWDWPLKPLMSLEDVEIVRSMFEDGHSDDLFLAIPTPELMCTALDKYASRMRRDYYLSEWWVPCTTADFVESLTRNPVITGYYGVWSAIRDLSRACSRTKRKFWLPKQWKKPPPDADVVDAACHEVAKILISLGATDDDPELRAVRTARGCNYCAQNPLTTILVIGGDWGAHNLERGIRLESFMDTEP